MHLLDSAEQLGHILGLPHQKPVQYCMWRVCDMNLSTTGVFSHLKWHCQNWQQHISHLFSKPQLATCPLVPKRLLALFPRRQSSLVSPLGIRDEYCRTTPKQISFPIHCQHRKGGSCPTALTPLLSPLGNFLIRFWWRFCAANFEARTPPWPSKTAKYETRVL